MKPSILKPGTLLIILSLLFLSPPCARSNPEEGGSDDRRSKQKKSAAAALAASASLKVMCLKQMSDAMAEEDKDKRDEKMNMAMMMCAQADAMAQNGKENEEGSKKTGSGAIAATPSPTFETPNLETQPNSDEFNTDLLRSASSRQSSGVPTGSSSTTPENSRENTTDKPISAKDSFTEDKTFGFGIPLKNKENSNSEDNGRIALNEPALGAFPLNGLNAGSLSNNRNPTSISNAPVLGTLPSKDLDSNDKEGKDKSQPGATSNGSFDEMLAKYMGGGGATNPFAAASLSGEIIDIAYGLKISGQRPKTIFEFASEQYQKAKPTKKIPQR